MLRRTLSLERYVETMTFRCPVAAKYDCDILRRCGKAFPVGDKCALYIAIYRNKKRELFSLS